MLVLHHGVVTDTDGMYLLHQCRGCLCLLQGTAHQCLLHLTVMAADMVAVMEGTTTVAGPGTKLNAIMDITIEDMVVGTTDSYGSLELLISNLFSVAALRGGFFFRHMVLVMRC